MLFKDEVKENLTLENIFDFLQDFGGEPQYTKDGIVAQTIDHNPAHTGSRKLYYYDNSKLFVSYSGGDGGFDIFELTQKIFKIQKGIDLKLNEAINFVATTFGFSEISKDFEDLQKLKDWEIFENYDRIKEISVKDTSILLEEYDSNILDRFNYKIKLVPWLMEDISQEVLDKNRIGYFPGGAQITIPHYDIDNRLIGIRGRTMIKSEAEAYGKYRPIVVNKKQYNHPLGLNLYNLNNSKEVIKNTKTAIIFESEKSSLKFQTYFGDNDFSVACCGSNISNYQMQLLLKLGVKEVIIAFDRQFQKLGDDEYLKLIKNFKKIQQRYKNYTNISFIIDYKKITDYKAAPIDEGMEKFLTLFKDRKRNI